MGRYDWEHKLERRQASQRKSSKTLWWFVGLVVAPLCAAALLLGFLNFSDQQKLNDVKNTAEPTTSMTQSGIDPAEREEDNVNVLPTGSEAQVNNPGIVQKFGSLEFKKCAELRVTCVVDGDTIWLEGIKIRIADIDTPEVDQSRCAEERALGQQATNRLIELLNLGPFEIHSSGPKDEDIYERKLRLVVREGISIGDKLVSEGLARKWNGQRQPWCT